MPDLDNGLMEKVYQFEVQDCLLDGNTPPEVITPIRDISVLLENADYTLKVPQGAWPTYTSNRPWFLLEGTWRWILFYYHNLNQ